LSFSILKNSPYKFVGQTLIRTEGTKTAVLIVEQTAAVGGNPKRSIAPGRQGSNVVIHHCRRVEPGVDNKADAVESGEPSRRTNPEVTIGRLGERADPAFRQAVLCPPGSAHIFDSQRGSIFNCCGARRREQNQSGGKRPEERWN